MIALFIGGPYDRRQQEVSDSKDTIVVNMPELLPDGGVAPLHGKFTYKKTGERVAKLFLFRLVYEETK